MHVRSLAVTGVLALAVTAAVLRPAIIAGQGAPQTGAVPNTPWGAPDLQGTWGNHELVPLERAPEYGTREFLTDAELANRQKQVTERAREAQGGLTGFRDQRKVAGSEQDVAGAYNAIWEGVPLTKAGKRTSQVVAPPDGRIPASTPEAKKRIDAQRDYLNMLLRGSSGSRDQGPPATSGERAQRPPVYNLDRMNRADGPEDNSSMVRCFGEGVPQVGSIGGINGSRQRIVQSADALAIYYDIGQGFGFSRVIPISDKPHLTGGVPQIYGDSRGRWEGNALVVETTNFGNRTQFRGARENLRVTERFTRLDTGTLEYRVTLNDPTTWTKPWTMVIDLTRENDKPNQIYQQTCHEGNYGIIGILANTRAAERLFEEGKGKDPATMDISSGGGGGGGGQNVIR